MKKLFLTSGIIACMACPAFADPTGFSSDSVGRNGSANVYPIGENEGATTAQLSASNVANACVVEAIGVTQGASTLTAQWDAIRYTISYAAGDVPSSAATGATITGTAPSPTSVSFDDNNITLEENTFALTGHHFTGWKSVGKNLEDNTNVDTTYYGTAAADPRTPAVGADTLTQYRVPESRTLYAQWAPNKYTVTYNKGSHATAGSTTDYVDQNYAVYGSTYNAVSNSTASIAAADGYTFCGWSTDANATCTDPQNFSGWSGEAPWRRTDDLTVTAIYKANGYTITYNCTAPSGATQSPTTAQANTQNVTFAGGFTLLSGSTICTLPGYTFTGWSCDDFSGASQNAATYGTEANAGAATVAAYNIVGNATCTAIWRQNRIGLTWLDGNHTGDSTVGITGGGSQCSYDGTVQLPQINNVPGYTFTGFTVTTTSPNAAEPQIP